VACFSRGTSSLSCQYHSAVASYSNFICHLPYIFEGKKALGRPRLSFEHNIKMDLREVGWGAWTGSMWPKIETGGGLL
jgi:hypothetical protein